MHGAIRAGCTAHEVFGTFQNTVLARPGRNGGEQSYVSYMVDLHTYVSYITTSSVLGVSPGSPAPAHSGSMIIHASYSASGEVSHSRRTPV